jgi:hypothetical protein
MLINAYFLSPVESALASVADVRAFLGQTINLLRKGGLDPKVANCAGYLAGILLKAFDAGDMAREVAEMRQHLEELQRAASSPASRGPSIDDYRTVFEAVVNGTAIPAALPQAIR